MSQMHIILFDNNINDSHLQNLIISELDRIRRRRSDASSQPIHDSVDVRRRRRRKCFILMCYRNDISRFNTECMFLISNALTDTAFKHHIDIVIVISCECGKCNLGEDFSSHMFRFVKKIFIFSTYLNPHHEA